MILEASVEANTSTQAAAAAAAHVYAIVHIQPLGNSAGPRHVGPASSIVRRERMVARIYHADDRQTCWL